MVPGCLLFHKPVVKDKSTVIIQTCDKIPLLIRIRRELMVRGIVLDEFSNIICLNLPVMGFSLSLFWFIKTFFLCSINYGRK